MADGARTPSGDVFPTSVDGIEEAVATEVVELAAADAFDLEIRPVRKLVGDSLVRMLAYNGSIPGPTIAVSEGSAITVSVTNRGDIETTVHWHGLRLRNEFDGTHETQEPIPVGGTFTYELEFPDPGIYWYHPHIREDYAQELGLYGNILVSPAEPDYWSAVDREVVVTLDDLLVEEGRIATFDAAGPTHVAMGRFGNTMLAAGETNPSLPATCGETVRLYLTNTANARVFNVMLPGARLKLVGGDSGHYEHEQLVDEVLLAPSERVVLDVFFDEPGDLVLEHRTPERAYPLASIPVVPGSVDVARAKRFGTLRTNADMVAERERIAAYVEAEPDKTLAFVAEMDLGGSHQGAGLFSCPMHPEVTSTEPERCPKCGMKLVPAHLVTTAEHGHEHHMETVSEPESSRGIEWEDDMAAVNRLTTPATVRWKLVDRATGAENAAIDWRFRVGDQVKIQLVNELDSDHPMPHPFHIHGAGRFLILARDGAIEENLVWKDTVLVRTGETVDILLDVTNPGRWMAHCHIAEHHEGGMMLGFLVDPAT